MRGFYESRVYFPGKPPDLQPRTPDRPVWSVSPPFRELFSRIVWPSDVWHVLEHESHVYHFKETTTLAWTFSPLTTHHTYSRAAGLGGARNDSSTLSMLLDTQLAGRPNGRPARCGPKQNSPEGCERMSPLNFGAIYIYIYIYICGILRQRSFLELFMDTGGFLWCWWFSVWCRSFHIPPTSSDHLCGFGCPLARAPLRENVS